MPGQWYAALAADTGQYVEGGTDLRELLRVIREDLAPDGDVLVTCQGLAVAVVCGDGQTIIIPGRAWQCVDCGSPVPHGFTRCDACVRQPGLPVQECGRCGRPCLDATGGCGTCGGQT
jgi:hypothetical protein